MARKFAGISELWSLTAQHVEQDSDLISVVLVNRQVSSAAIAVLWHTINICELQVHQTGIRALGRLLQLVDALRDAPALARLIKHLVVPSSYQSPCTTRHRDFGIELLELVPNVKTFTIISTASISSWHSAVSNEVHAHASWPNLPSRIRLYHGDVLHRSLGQGFWDQHMFGSVSFKAERVNGAFIGTPVFRAFLTSQAASLLSWYQTSPQDTQAWEAQPKLPLLREVLFLKGSKASAMLDSLLYKDTLRALHVGHDFSSSGFLAMRFHTALESLCIDLSSLLPWAGRSPYPRKYLRSLRSAVPGLKRLMIQGNNFISVDIIPDMQLIETIILSFHLPRKPNHNNGQFNTGIKDFQLDLLPRFPALRTIVVTDFLPDVRPFKFVGGFQIGLDNDGALYKKTGVPRSPEIENSWRLS